MPATLQQVRNRIEKSGGEARLARFAEILFNKADPEFLDTFDPDELTAMAADGLAFLDSLGDARLRVQVYNPSFEADGWEGPFTVLRLCLRDRPFIVDSVRAELRRRGFHLVHLLHPIYSVRRDDSGTVAELAERKRQGDQEAFEMYFLERVEDAGLRQGLAASVTRVLNDVILATDDYQPMRGKAVELRDYMQRLRDQAANGPHRERAEELEEYAAFMEWLDDENFVFLGYREYDILPGGRTRSLKVTPDSGLGILSKIEESAYREPVPIEELPEGLRERVTGGRIFIVTKTNAESTVHRPVRMDYIGVKKVSGSWEVEGEQRFVGLFTTKALSAPVDEIPILRRKLRQVLDLDDAIPDSHDWKQIVAIFNSMPREELFWADAMQLHKDIRTIMGLEQERGVRLTVRPDPLARGLAVMAIMPRDRFNAEVRRSIQGFLGRELEATHVDYQLAMGEDEDQVRFHFFFTTAKPVEELDVKGLEREVAELTRSWEDELVERLIARHGQSRGRRIAERYVHAFDERYRADTNPGAALRDIDNLEALGARPYLVDLLAPPPEGRGPNASLLKIYHHNRTLVLSDVLPILENIGLRVLEQISYWTEHARTERGIDVFRVQNLAGEPIDIRRDRDRLVEGLSALLIGDAENDRLNRLVLAAGLSVRQVALLRAYQMYYSQLSAVTSRRFINETLLAHPRVAALLFEYFRARFEPELEGDRLGLVSGTRAAFFESLAEVSSLPEDAALRGLFDLMEATDRTNFFLGRPVISFKLDSRRVATMPEPRPLYEIAVLGVGVEGTHLRGGKVARGGIRWSDRPDDFRTEILGLMKTQMTKNAVIVPVGSKGGFVLKHPPADREALRSYVQEQYRAYIRGLLDITDNMMEGEIVHPPGLVVYDEPDPYLVVAADKGTATFSDLANATAAEYDFWLGDAFASGGSYGYDHKAIGITARGAWKCVERHFSEIGIDPFRDTFTVAGIGDMSGDVFGNGMLHTDRIRLQAAFNHLHIFLDPDPDPRASYAERRRLFELPRSTWRDYDPKVISKGGGIFDRGAKAIMLSSQARAMLGLEAEVVSGPELVRAILRMPVDLLWNGGIGTYVKASTETHQVVGDAANDAVRVDAGELRCRVVGEGGNLGLTQLARIEYALGGGHINTDAIDNSGGVDMSDHEVNIKILLQPLVGSGELSLAQRNRLLREMTEEVSELVLKDNERQSLALSLAERRSQVDPLLFASLQDYLAERGGLDPVVEFMPNRRTIAERQKNGLSYTRPELAVLMAYAKMGLYRRLLETDFPEETHFQHYLFAYFPKVLAERFPSAIASHPLRREIIATQFTNTVVDILGITFVHRTIRDTGATPVEVIRAALIALEMLDVEDFLRRLFGLSNRVSTEMQYEALADLVQAVEGIVTWILLSDLTATAVKEFVATYREPLGRLRMNLSGFLPPQERRRYERGVARLRKAGLDETLAAEVASFDYLPASVGVIDVARRCAVPLDEAAKRFYALGERLSLGWLRDALDSLPTAGKWEKIALGGLIMDLRRVQRNLTEAYVRARSGERNLGVEAFLERYPNLLQRYDQVLAEVREADALSLASGGVLTRLLTQAEAPQKVSGD